MSPFCPGSPPGACRQNNEIQKVKQPLKNKAGEEFMLAIRQEMAYLHCIRKSNTGGKKQKKDYEHLKEGKVYLCLYILLLDYWLFLINLKRTHGMPLSFLV